MKGIKDKYGRPPPSLMGFIEQFFKDKVEILPEDIEFFISQKIEENINLDYKDIRMYNDPDKLAAHVASFANAEGGLIILGVSEDKIKDEKGNIIRIFPKEITWGEMSLDKETLENKLSVRIKPQIDGLIIKPARKEEKVIFLLDIPKSNCSPHMSPDHKYNKRINFGIHAMDHHEVANLFRVNWTMKEKLVEKIYEPLASVLEKHAYELMEYSSPSKYEIEEILSRTYYRVQMPFELLERIDYYMDQIDDLAKKINNARIAVNEIVSKSILACIGKSDVLNGNVRALIFLPFELKMSNESKKMGSNLDQNTIYRLLLKSQKLQAYINLINLGTANDLYTIFIKYSNQDYPINLKEFDKLVWNKCLKNVSKNTDIIQVRKDSGALCEEVYDLIEEITRY
jgi:hypothetical protein